MKLYMKRKQSSSGFADFKATVEISTFEMMSLPLLRTISLSSNPSVVSQYYGSSVVILYMTS